MLRCYCRNDFQKDAADFAEHSTISRKLAYWEHPWGQQFKAVLLDSIKKTGYDVFKPQIPLAHGRDLAPLIALGREHQCSLVILARCDVTGQDINRHYLGFLTKAFFCGFFLLINFLPQRSTLTLTASNHYMVYSLNQNRLVLDEGYTKTGSEDFESVTAMGNYMDEFIQTRQNLFLKLQNELTGLFWDNFYRSAPPE